MRMGEDRCSLDRTRPHSSPVCFSRPGSCVTRKLLPTVRQPSTAGTDAIFLRRPYTNPPPVIRATNTSPARHWAKTLVVSAKGRHGGKPGQKFFAYTRHDRRTLRKLRILGTARPLARSLLAAYNPPGLGDRPKGCNENAEDTTTEAPFTRQVGRSPDKPLRQTVKIRHRGNAGIRPYDAKRKLLLFRLVLHWRYDVHHVVVLLQTLDQLRPPLASP